MISDILRIMVFSSWSKYAWGFLALFTWLDVVLFFKLEYYGIAFQFSVMALMMTAMASHMWYKWYQLRGQVIPNAVDR